MNNMRSSRNRFQLALALGLAVACALPAFAQKPPPTSESSGGGQIDLSKALVAGHYSAALSAVWQRNAKNSALVNYCVRVGIKNDSSEAFARGAIVKLGYYFLPPQNGGSNQKVAANNTQPKSPDSPYAWYQVSTKTMTTAVPIGATRMFLEPLCESGISYNDFVSRVYGFHGASEPYFDYRGYPLKPGQEVASSVNLLAYVTNPLNNAATTNAATLQPRPQLAPVQPQAPLQPMFPKKN